MERKPPFKVGDVVCIKNWEKGNPADILRTVTKVRWIGKGHSQSGWLVDAEPMNPKHEGKGLMNYDSDWFELA